MDNFFYILKSFFFMKSQHVGVSQTPVSLLSFANFLRTNMLSRLDKIMSKNKASKFLYFQGFVVAPLCLFIYLWITCS